MATLRVDALDFHFEPNMDPRKYDESRHYADVLRKAGKKGVDVVAVETGSHPRRAWAIEVKDYRILRGLPRDSTPSQIATDVHQKVQDTFNGLEDAMARAADAAERSHASRALSAPEREIVFHLEPYAGPVSKLFPNPTANVYQKLRQLFGPGTPLLVLNMETTRRADVPWTVTSVRLPPSPRVPRRRRD